MKNNSLNWLLTLVAVLAFGVSAFAQHGAAGAGGGRPNLPHHRVWALALVAVQPMLGRLVWGIQAWVHNRQAPCWRTAS